jgi:hypothetical protein
MNHFFQTHLAGCFACRKEYESLAKDFESIDLELIKLIDF